MANPRHAFRQDRGRKEEESCGNYRRGLSKWMPEDLDEHAAMGSPCFEAILSGLTVTASAIGQAVAWININFRMLFVLKKEGYYW